MSGVINFVVMPKRDHWWSVGVGTAGTSPSNTTVGIGTTSAARTNTTMGVGGQPGQSYMATRPAVGHKQPGTVPYHPSPSGPSTPSPSLSRGRRGRTMNQAQMQQQLEEILQEQQQTADGRHIAGITTTNTITTTYKNGRRPTVTRNSTSVRN